MKELNLGSDKISKLLFTFSVPCVISMLVGALYNIVDQIFIGQSVGFLGNAATNVVYPFTVIALAFALLIGDGATALLSLSLGRDDKKMAKKVVGQAIIAILFVAVILTVFGFLFRDGILTVFGVTPNSYGFASDYLTIILIGIPFYLLSTGLNGIIRADGSPRYAMISTLVGAILNIILDPIFIFVFDLGVKGAAVATIIGQIISFIVSFIYFRKPKSFKLDKEAFGFNFRIVKKVLQLGISSFITQSSIVLIIATINNLINLYGANSAYGADIPLSALGIVMKVFGIAISFIIGISVGGQPIIGYNYGASKIDRVKQTFKYILLSNVVVGVIAFCLFEFAPLFIVNLFGNESVLYNEFAVSCFRIYLGGILITCVVKTVCIFLQSVGSSVKAMILSVTRDVFLLIPSLVILAKIGGVKGMLFAPWIADGVSFLIAIFFARHEFKKFDNLNSYVDTKEDEITKIASKRRVVVTINREYGSGGRYVGKLLAEKLGVSFYDKELIRLVSEKSGLSKEYIEKSEQTKDILSSYYYLDNELFVNEAKVIKDIAKESCIIVGRCADYILKDCSDAISVFLYSDDESKVKRAVQYYGLDKKNALKTIRKINKKRKEHYHFYTDCDWTDLTNYDLSICVDALGVEKTADILYEYIKKSLD